VTLFCKIVQGLKPHLSVGGTNIGDEVEKIEKEKPNLIIGTVGRIWDLT